MRRPVFVILVVVAVIHAAAIAGIAGASTQLKRLSEREVDALEQQADAARALFFSNRYDQAAAIFEKLSTDLTACQPLYLNELGTCYLAMGRMDDAKRAFLAAAELADMYDPQSEKKALSLFGAEARKLYKGDPYERSMAALLLGLLFLRGNDVDNALACFKNGILCDSDVAAETYKSDIVLLYALASRCHRLRGETELAAQTAAQATNAYLATHPWVSPLARMENMLAEAVQKNKNAEEVQFMTDLLPTVQAKRKEVEQKVSLVPIRELAEGDCNVLLLIAAGQGPEKQRIGQYGEKYVIIQPERNDLLRYEVGEETNVVDPIRNVCDVTFQATTRGGRLMDNVMENKAAFKRAASEIGNQALKVDYNRISDPRARLIAMGIGLTVAVISKTVSAATAARSDIRCWRTLPGEFQVAPLKLEPGIHKMKVVPYEGYFRCGPGRDVEIKAPQAGSIEVLVVIS